jgi:energy-coupling factor transport system substrate-specific component
MNLLISSALVALPLIVLIFALERRRPRPRDLMPVVVLTALAIVGRIIALPIPNFQPATALIILAGFFFGRHAGLLSGMLVALISNMIMGQGPWTPWQMLAWGLVGYGAGLMAKILGTDTCMTKAVQSAERRRDKLKVFLPIAAVIGYGFFASLLFGMVMDLHFFVAYVWESGLAGLLATWTLGLPLNIAHAVSTLLFLSLTLLPWGRKLQRLKVKYGIKGI